MSPLQHRLVLRTQQPKTLVALLGIKANEIAIRHIRSGSTSFLRVEHQPDHRYNNRQDGCRHLHRRRVPDIAGDTDITTYLEPHNRREAEIQSESLKTNNVACTGDKHGWPDDSDVCQCGSAFRVEPDPHPTVVAGTLVKRHGRGSGGIPASR